MQRKACAQITAAMLAVVRETRVTRHEQNKTSTQLYVTGNNRKENVTLMYFTVKQIVDKDSAVLTSIVATSGICIHSDTLKRFLPSKLFLCCIRELSETTQLSLERIINTTKAAMVKQVSKSFI